MCHLSLSAIPPSISFWVGEFVIHEDEDHVFPLELPLADVDQLEVPQGAVALVTVVDSYRREVRAKHLVHWHALAQLIAPVRPYLTNSSICSILENSFSNSTFISESF